MYKYIILIIFALLMFGYFVYLLLVFRRTKVPIVITPKKYFKPILENLDITPQTIIYDLGCGTGSFLFAAEKYGPKEIRGFELSPLHVLYGKAKALILRSKADIYLQDYFTVDLSNVDIIYIFSIQPAVIKLWKKIQKEAKRGTLVVVLSDSIPDEIPEKIIKVKVSPKKSSNVYVYRIE